MHTEAGNENKNISGTYKQCSLKVHTIMKQYQLTLIHIFGKMKHHFGSTF